MRFGLLFLLLVAICCGCCCCGRIPTFTLWPAVDEEVIHADVLASRATVDHLCTGDVHCGVVEEADVDIVGTAWNPLTDTVVTTIAVEAWCRETRAIPGSAERGKPLKEEAIGERFVCVGLLAAVGTVVGDVVVHEEVTESAVFALPHSGRRRLPSESSGGSRSSSDWDAPSGDWDWD